MRPAGKLQWSFLFVVALFVVVAWPPHDDKSLALKFVNRAVDPTGALPVLPDALALGQGDDPAAVESHHRQTQQYDALYLKGGWTRTRLHLKVANDPFNPATERQILTLIGVATALAIWKLR